MTNTRELTASIIQTVIRAEPGKCYTLKIKMNG